MTDPLFLIERDLGTFGIEGMAYREWTRSKVVELCALEYREGFEDGRGESDVIRVLEIRMDAKPEDITEEIMREAELMRAEYHKEAAE